MTLPHLFGGPFAGYMEWLLRASISATFIAAAILLVQLLFGRWLTPAWRYRLWAVMVVRLLLPALPASPVSLSNLDLSTHIHRAWVSFRNEHGSDLTPGESKAPSVDAQQPTVKVIYGAPPLASRQHILQATQSPGPVHEPPVRLPLIVFLLWLAGVVVFLTRLVAANWRLARSLRQAVLANDRALLDRFRDCCDRAAIRRRPELWFTGAVRIPATAGLWRPRILLPPGLFDGLSDQQQRMVLLHELAHVKCRDVLSNWLLAVAQIIHWFNPAIAWAIRRLKVDREIARDAMVLLWIGGQDADAGREHYARTLLDLTESLSAGPRCLGLAAGLAGICTPAAGFTSGSFGRGSALKRRLQMIGKFDQKVRRSTLLGTLLILMLIGSTLTRAQDRPAPVPATNPASPTVAERQVGHSGNDEMFVAEARAYITSHRYDLALTVLKEIRLENPKSKLLDDVVPKLLRQIATEERRVRATHEDAQKQLDRILPELTFDAVGLWDVIDFLRDATGANIFVNWKSLELAKIDRNVPITARLRNIKFSKALSIILDAAGGGGKLGYAVDDGVIAISTVDDLSKNVEVRVYDVRDLLTTPPDFVPPRLGVPEPVNAAVPATQSSAREGMREDLVKAYVRLIEDTVAPVTWKDHGGNVGAIRELQGQLIITQTPENQIAIMALLQQLRETHGLQCTVEARIISCPDSVASGLLAKWQKVSVPATLPTDSVKRPGAGAVGLFMDKAQVSQFLETIANDPQMTLIDAPRLTLFDGQRAYVQVSKSRRYTSGYSAVAAPSGQIRYEPIASAVETGLLFDVQTTVTGDRKSVMLSLHPQISELLGMKDIPWVGRPAGSNLMVQEPQVRSTELHTTVNIPNNMTLLIGGLEDPRVASSSGPATQPGMPLRSLFLLVRVTIIREIEQRPEPLLPKLTPSRAATKP